MKIGTKVKIKNTKSMKSWGYNNQTGVVIGSDPRDCNSDVVSVRLDSGPSLLEFRGIHISNLELSEEKARGE
jgi:hypothetical protein